MSYIFSICLFLFPPISFYFWGANYFAQNLFSGWATIFSAWVVLVVYYAQKRDSRIKAAQILLMEIRGAEQALDRLRIEGVVEDTVSVLPVNSWAEAQHMFVKIMDQDEFGQIANFYNMCSVIDDHVERQKSFISISNEAKVKLIQQKLLELADRHKDRTEESKNAYETEKAAILEYYHQEAYNFEPNLPKSKIREYVPYIQYITTSTCGTKLKRLAKDRRFL